MLNSTFQDRIENVLKYIEDRDLHRWSLPDIRAFGIGINQWHSKLNCITNPHMYEQVCFFFLFFLCVCLAVGEGSRMEDFR